MNIRTSILEYLHKLGFSTIGGEIMLSIIYLFFVIILAVILNYFAKKAIVGTVSRIIKKSKNPYDDILVSKKVFNLLSHLVPAIVLNYGIMFIFSEKFAYPFQPQNIINFIQSACYIYSVIVVLVVINSFLNALYEIYLHFPIAKTINIKGYFQVLKIIFLLIGIVLIVAALVGKSPLTILTGLGAVTAVLLLIFKDTIMGFVATIQLSAFKLIKPGDPILVPKYGIDGTILEISIVSIRILNADKSITSFPTYSLIIEAFTNNAPIAETGLHKFKQKIKIDPICINFCSNDFLEKFSEKKWYTQLFTTNEIQAENITNLILYRKFLEDILWNSTNISNETPACIYVKEQTEKGVFLEVTGFYKENSKLCLDEFLSRFMETAFAAMSIFNIKA